MVFKFLIFLFGSISATNSTIDERGKLHSGSQAECGGIDFYDAPFVNPPKTRTRCGYNKEMDFSIELF